MPTLLPSDRRNSGFILGGRKQSEAILMALLSITAVGCLRYPVESRALFLSEMISIAILFGLEAAVVFRRRYLSIVLLAVPIVTALISRRMGTPIAFEMTALMVFGAASLAMSIGCNRTRAMSLVASGFLTLFSVAISDSPRAVVMAIAWMAVCVWHLVANHWERLELCAVQQVRRGAGVRPVSVFAAIAVFIVSGLAVRDRLGESKRFRFGFMPTSGGSQWSDPAARSGVGTGDAAIAAKDHAESFGAVESDLFLESTESTLFDMFNDSIGEPKKKNKWERRQGLTPEKLIQTHEQTAKSEKGGSSFSTDRLAPKKHMHLKDSPENAVVQWDGPSGIRLAMNRYDTFDGVDWSNQSSHRNESLLRREINRAVWFFDPTILTAGKEPSAATTTVSLLKVLRLDSTRIPTPMMTSGLHIKDVDRQDFFGIEDDGAYFMPGREKVPPLTVVNVASAIVMEDELWAKLDRQTRFEPLAEGQPKLVTDLAAQWSATFDHPYEKLRAIVSHLRSEFAFDRTGGTEPDDPITEFLETRRGGDHLFATTAALMASEIGLQARLVTGFYVRPSAIDIAAGHTNVLPEDVHVWAEVKLEDGRWFEIEPTPGFQEPSYQPSTWLVAKRLAANYWPHAVGCFGIGMMLFLSRLFWIELSLSVLYPVAAIVWPRSRLGLAMKVLQTRARLAGCPRAPGCPQRDWLLSLTQRNLTIGETARRFCDEADRMTFAGVENTSASQDLVKELLMTLKIKTLRRIKAETLV